jgi:hypothetical protein
VDIGRDRTGARCLAAAQVKRRLAAALLTATIALAGDPVAELNRRLIAGQAHLKFENPHGYLRSVLDALQVPVESQMLVFSKTSGQAMRIGPHAPRALFFNDAVAVGWVHGGFLELAAQDPQKGMVFYSLDQRAFVQPPRFEQRQDCLHCHSTGTIIQSVVTASDGVPVRHFGVTNTDQRTAFEKLWGGWYVTGEGGRHMGSAVDGQFDAGAYPAAGSDIVTLMVFEHQMQMMNLIAAARERDVTNELVDYMLFVDEAPLPAKVRGAPGFAAKFSAQGPLREFDLEHRLMRYPCSYMIYTAAFDGLPATTKAMIYKRMWRVLSGEESGGKYARLSLADRQAVVGVLMETKAGLPSYFRQIH